MKIAIPALYLDSNQINLVSVPEMHLISSTDNLIYSSVLRIKDISGTLDSQVKYGTKLTISYYDDESGKKLVECPLRIISFDKICSSAPTNIDELRVTAISEWYFQQNAARKAFYGSVAAIVKEATLKETFFSKKSIENSSDTQCLRYQLLERPCDFLERIVNYALNDGSPMYLYCTIEKELVLRSKKSIVSSTPVCTLVPFMDGKAEVSRNSQGRTLSMYSVAFYAKGAKANAIRKHVFSVKHTPESQLSSIKTSAAISSIETEEELLVSSHSGDSASITGWEVAPYDAISSAISGDDKLDQELFSAVAIVPSTVATSVGLGAVVNLKMNDSRCPENGTYYIKYIDHQLNDGALYSKLHLVRIAQ